MNWNFTFTNFHIWKYINLFLNKLIEILPKTLKYNTKLHSYNTSNQFDQSVLTSNFSTQLFSLVTSSSPGSTSLVVFRKSFSFASSISTTVNLCSRNSTQFCVQIYCSSEFAVHKLWWQFVSWGHSYLCNPLIILTFHCALILPNNPKRECSKLEQPPSTNIT